MRITQFSIEHHVAVLVFCVGVLLLGAVAYVTMPRDSFPDVDLPYVIVSTFLDGANPSDIEESVTIPLETEMDSIEGLKELRSASMDSFSMISLEFQPDVEIEVALNRVRDAVDRAKPDLATEAEEPVVKEFSVSSFPVLVYHFVSNGSVTISELDDMAERIEDELKTIPGVLDIDRFGSREREIHITIDPDRLHFYNLSLSQVEGILRGTNRNVSAGTAENGTNRIVMRVPGEFVNPAEIFNLVVGATPKGIPIYLRDIGTAAYGFEDEVSRARLYDFSGPDGASGINRYVAGKPSVSLQIKKRIGVNILEMCREVDARIQAQPIPPTVQVIKGLDSSKDVNLMVADLENGIGTSLVLVLAVIFIGLGALNAVLVAAAIPFSLLISIIILRAMGETLNMMILFSLILSLGMLVDNAIVIVENIYRHYSLGVPRARAAFIGTSEVAWPVITSTATTVGAFVPLLFWPGVIGEFMSYLPRTVIIVLVASLFVAMVINPTLASLVMSLKKGAARNIDPETQRPTYWLVRKYQPILEFLLDRPMWTLTTSLVLLALVFSLYALFGAGTELFPPTDPDTVYCSIKPPEGISLDESDRLARQMEDRLLGAPGSGYSSPVHNLRHVSTVVGLEGVGGSSALQEDNSGPIRLQIELVDREFRDEPSTRTLEEMRLRVEGLDREGRRIADPLFGGEYSVTQEKEGPPTGAPVSVDVFGENLSAMTRVVHDMKAIMIGIPGTVKPSDDAVTAQPTLEWEVDRARAGMLGLDQSTVSTILQIAVGGMNTGTFGHGDDEQDIVLRLPERFRLDTGRLKNVTIPSLSGGSVPIASVAGSKLVPGPVTIKHYNTRRVLNASAEVQPGIRQDADIRKRFQERASAYPWPPGITHRFGGAAEDEAESRAFLSQSFAIALFIILMVLVLQFNSVLVSGIVMCSVVLSLMGVFAGLLIMRAPFGIIMTGIGVISLAGVVVNNAIVLLDAIHQFEKQGQSPRHAVVSAAMIRFRPVLLTAITTILGLVPMALKLNWDFRAMTWQYNTESSQWWQSMSMTVIFGLLVATVLTLGIVPTLYLEFSRIRAILFPRRQIPAASMDPIPPVTS